MPADHSTIQDAIAKALAYDPRIVPDPPGKLRSGPKRVDHADKEFGRLTAICYVGRKGTAGNMRTIWWCRCECDTELPVSTSHLVNGDTQSCGCLASDMLRAATLTHGDTLGGDVSPEYATWTEMRKRCNKPTHAAYANYGARGIRICERWSNFANFLADLGRRPGAGYSIERVDNDGNYEPSNCKWIPRSEQARNTRNSRRFNINGVVKCMAELAREYGIKADTLQKRLAAGWAIADALSVPIRQRRDFHNNCNT